MKIHTKSDYRAARRANYPELGDQLDALVALTESLRTAGHPLPEKTAQWLDACLDTKRRIRSS